jgi:hypothetical protein
MRIKSAFIALSSLIVSLLPAVANAQPVSACRISTSENQIVSLGFPFKPERLSYINNPTILVMPYRLKGETDFNFDVKEKDIFLRSSENISKLSSEKSKVSFVFSSVVDLSITAKEMDDISRNVKDTWQRDYANSTWGFVKKMITDQDKLIDYTNISGVVLVGSSKITSAWIAEAMMMTKNPFNPWFAQIATDEGPISNAVLIYNQLGDINSTTLTHEIMHLYGLTDLYGSATSPNHSLMSNGILNLLGIEEWVLGWLPDENVQCVNLDSELSKTSLDNKLSIKKSNRNQLIVIPTGLKTALIVEQVYQAGKNHLLFYSLDNDARPAITTFRDDYTFELFIDVSTTLGASRILTGKTFNLLVENNDGKDISFRLIPPSLMNTDEAKKLISTAEVNRQNAELKVKEEVAAKAAAELKIKLEAEAKAAAELKAKQEAEAKAAADKAAELKAKQDADAKAAAELKAKQDADAKLAADKAAAELKAKQEAEAKLAADKVAADLKVKQEAEAKVAADKAAAAASKKTTITCVKGKLTKKVTAVKPVCPKGYKKK